MSLYTAGTEGLRHGVGPRRTHYLELGADGRDYTLCSTLAYVEAVGRDDPRSPWFAGVTCNTCQNKYWFRESLAEAHRLGLPHVEHDECPGELGERFSQPSYSTNTKAAGCPVCGVITWASYQQVWRRPEYEWLVQMHNNPNGHPCDGWNRKGLWLWRTEEATNGSQ